MPTDKPRVVVTGAAGFIGSHLSEALLDRGYTADQIKGVLGGNLLRVARAVWRPRGER